MLPHPLSNLKIQRCYQGAPRFNGFYSRDSFPNKIKDGAYVTSFDAYATITTHLIALYSNDNKKTYFDSFGVKHNPKEIKKFIGKKHQKIFDHNKYF